MSPEEARGDIISVLIMLGVFAFAFLVIALGVLYAMRNPSDGSWLQTKEERERLGKVKKDGQN
jgi:archaellum biogenesis protein FlaJ (TadC family)